MDQTQVSLLTKAQGKKGGKAAHSPHPGVRTLSAELEEETADTREGHDEGAPWA